MKPSSPLRSLLLAVATWAAGSLQAQTTETPSTNQPSPLPDVVVVARREPEDRYWATNATSALKINVPLLETPQAVSVVPRALIDDQGVRKLEGALKNVAGVSYGGYYGEWDYFRIRGFDASDSVYLDGLLSGLYSPNEELWGLERVEVVKGPSSSLYGAGAPGGFVNLVSKRPRPEFFGEARFTAGSYGYYEADVDINGALNAEAGLYGRFNAMYRQNDSFVDYASAERFFIAPALTWEIGPDTSLTLLTSVKNDNIDMAFPLPAPGTVLPNPNGEIPLSRYIGNPAYGNDEWERLIRLGYELNHRFSEHLALRNHFRYEQNDWTSDDLAYPSFLEPDERTLNLSGWLADGAYQGYRVDTALEGTFETGAIEHTVTGGVDYRWTEQNYTGRNSTNVVTLDVFTPDYAAMPPFLYDDSFASSITDDDVGLYLQEFARLWKRITLTAGGRYDWTSSGDQSATAFSPRVGLTYELIKGLAAYASYSRSFQPQWGFVDAAGQGVAPARGNNYELGLKSELWDGRLYGLFSIYDLTLHNVATPDPSTPDPNDSIVTGEQRSRGVELEGGYRFAPGWEFIAAYSYIDAEVVEDTSIPSGTRLWGVPENSFNAWLKYTVQQGTLRGLGFGLGGRYNTQQQGDATYTTPFTVPAYGVMDAAIFYARGPLQAQVNVGNVLDQRYFVGAYNEVYVLPGEPITVRGSVSWNF